MFWGGLILGAALGGYSTYLYTKSLYSTRTASLDTFGYDCAGNITCNVSGSSGDYRLYGHVYPASQTTPDRDFPHAATAEIDESGNGTKTIPGLAPVTGSVKVFVWMVDVVAYGESLIIDCGGGPSSSSSSPSSSSSSSNSTSSSSSSSSSSSR